MKTTILWMLSTLALTGLATVLSYPALGADPGPATKPDATSPDAKRLTFLGDQLSADEAAIKAINKALIQAGYHAAVANDKATDAASDNHMMDRKGGGPVPWQQFYGRTAKDFIMHDKFSPVYHQIDRPDQFDYVYRANNNQIESAKAEVDALGKKVDALLIRRRELEAEQSSLWATIAFESIGNRNISLRPLYRDELKAKPSLTDDNRPDGARVAALRTAVLYLGTLAHTTEALSGSLETSQESAYTSLRDTLQKSSDQLAESSATFADTAGVDPAEAKQMSDLASQARQIQALCKDVCEAFRKAKDADAAGEGEEQRKLLFRGTLQDSLFTFAEATAKMDNTLVAISDTWDIHGHSGERSTDHEITPAGEATYTAPTSFNSKSVIPTTGLTNTLPTTIKPGEIWPDDRGQHVQAHGGGIIKVGDYYYWFGEDRTMGLDRSKRYVSCYSSKDLAHWTFCNQVMKQADPENFGPRFVLERPKVFYNAKTKKFVMYMHIDDARYQVARVGVAVCDKVDGDYQYLKSFRPLDHESRDIGQFVDDDGSAYLIFEDRPVKGFHIAKLSDDFLTVEKDMSLLHEPLEGGAVVHYNDLYYAIGSYLTGWNPNPNQYATAKSLEGPWSKFQDIAPHDAKTYGSQSTMLLKVVGSKTTSVIFMGDIWKPRTQWDSRYLWLPVEIGDGKFHLPEPKDWTIDVETGEAVIKN